VLRGEQRRLRSALRAVLAIAIAVLTLSAAWWGYKQVVSLINYQFGIASYRVTYQRIYKDGLAKELDEWFAHMQSSGMLKKRTRASLTDEILQKYPLVARINWGTYVPGRLDCTIFGVTPVFRINDSFVAGDNAGLYSPKDFGLFAQTLPRIIVSPEWVTKGVFASVYTFISSIPVEIIDTYYISYKDPYYIVLAPRTSQEGGCDYVCIVDEPSAFSVKTVEEMQALCLDVKKRKKEKGEDVDACLFDFRFDNRIISKPLSRSEYARFVREVK